MKKITLDRKTIVDSLTRIGMVVQPKNVIPCFSDVYVEVRPTELLLLCSNGECQAEVVIPAVHNIEKDFKFHASHKLFLTACSNVREDTIEIKFKESDKYFSVNSKNGRYKIDFSQDIFPILNFSQDSHTVVDMKFIDHMRAGAGFCNKKDLRTCMQGATLVANDNILSFYASDTGTIYKFQTVTTCQFKPMIIPYDGLMAISKICLDDDIALQISDRSTRWISGRYTLTVQNLQFLKCDFDRVINICRESQEFVYVVDQMILAVKCVQPFCGDEEMGCIKLWRQDGVSYVSAVTFSGESVAHEQIKSFDQENDFEIYVHKNNILRCLQPFEGMQVGMHISNQYMMISTPSKLTLIGGINDRRNTV